MGTVTVFVSGNKSEIKNVARNEGKTIVDLVRNRTSRSSAPKSPGPVVPPAATQAANVAGDSDVILSQLRKLGELRDAGVLTENEFNAKKADLLGRL